VTVYYVARTGAPIAPTQRSNKAADTAREEGSTR